MLTGWIGAKRKDASSHSGAIFARYVTLPAMLTPLVPEIYRTIHTPTKWRDIVREIARKLEANGAALFIKRFTTDDVDVLGVTPSLEPKGITAFREHCRERSRLIAQIVRYGLYAPVLLSELESEPTSSQDEARFGFLAHEGMRHMAAISFQISPRDIGVLTLHRSTGEDFSAREKNALDAIEPHLRASVEIADRVRCLEIEKLTAVQALNGAGYAAFLVDRDMRLIQASPHAASLLKDVDGLAVIEDHLVSTSPAMNEKLAAQVRTTLNTFDNAKKVTATTLRLRGDNGKITTLEIAPFRQSETYGADAAVGALVSIRTQDRQNVPQNTVAELFDLSPAEAHVTSDLTGGLSITDIAKAQGVSVNTVRSHLRSIKLKTRTRRQGELIALVMKTGSPMI